jgi:uncharacterized membrane protein YphA (DoxX/SURF4 family)
MNAALWVVQVLLALAFVAAGSMKLFAYDRYKAMSEKKGPTGITRGLATFIGIAELAGAFGVVVPVATGAAPLLSPWAAVGLATVMLLAIATTCAAASRRPRPPFSLPWLCLSLSADFLTGREEEAGCNRSAHERYWTKTVRV